MQWSFSILRFLDETHCVRITNYLWTTDLLCFLQSQSDQSQCYLFFWSEVQGSASYFFFVGDNDDWDKCLWSRSVHLQRRYLFLCSELQVSFGEHSAYKLSSSSVLGATPCACVLQRSLVFCKIIGTKDWKRAQGPLALNRDQIHLDHQQMSVCPQRSERPLRRDSTIFICLFLCFSVWKIRKKALISN